MAPPAGMGRRRIGLVATGTIAIGICVFALVASLFGRVADPASAFLGIYASAMYTFVGVTVLWRRPGHGIGRLALLLGLAFAIGVLLSMVAMAPNPNGVQTILARPVQLLIDIAGLVSGALLGAGLILGVSLLVTWFPDGHRTSRLGRLIEVLLAVSALAVLATAAARPDPS